MMRVIPCLLALVTACSAQTISGSFSGTFSAPQNTGSVFGASSVISEYFPSSTPSSGSLTWTINSDAYAANETAVTWYTSSGSQTTPGFNIFDYGHGGASTPWALGTAPFDLKFDHIFNQAIELTVSYGSVTWPLQSGVQVGVCTDPVGAYTYQTICVYWALSYNGPRMMVTQGIPDFEQGTASYVQSTNTLTHASGDALVANSWIYYVGAWRQINSAGTGFATNAPTTNESAYNYSGFVELSQLNNENAGLFNTSTYYQGSTPLNSWPKGANISSLPNLSGLSLNAPFTFEITRDSANNLTFNAYSTEYLGGGGTNPYAYPWFTGVCNIVGTGSNPSCNIPGGAFTAAYVNVQNLNADHTGWTPTSCTSTVCYGPETTTGGAVAPTNKQGLAETVYNIRGYGATTGTMPAVTGIIPSGASTTFQSGSTVTIQGTNLSPGSTLTVGPAVNIGGATTGIYQSGIATSGSGSSLTATLPAEPTCTIAPATAPCPTYRVAVIDPSGVEIPLRSVTPWQQIWSGTANESSTSGIYWPIQPPGLIYSSAGVLGVDPIDVLAGDTITLNGSGFSAGMTATIGGTACGSLTVTSPIQATCTAPSLNAGIKSLVTTNPSFTSANGFDLGYGGHPLIMTSSSLAAAETNFAGATTPCSNWTPTSGICWYDYAEPINQNIAAIPAYGANYNPADYTLGATAATGHGVPATILPAFPSLFGAAANGFGDYLWHGILNTATLTTDLSNAYAIGGLQTELNRINFSSSTPLNQQPFELENVNTVASTYDLYMGYGPSPFSLSQRIQQLRYLKYAQSYCNSTSAGGDSWLKGTTAFSGSPNFVPQLDGGCAMADIALLNVNYQVNNGGTSSNLYNRVTNIVRYPQTMFFEEGAPIESGQYWQFGLSAYYWFALALKNATGLDTGGTTSHLLTQANLANNASWTQQSFGIGGQFNSTGVVAGCTDMSGWTYGDTQPQHYGTAVLGAMANNISGASTQLLLYSDCLAHQITAASSPYTNYLEQQVSDYAYAPMAFFLRGSTVASAFGGWTMLNGSSSLNGGPTINGNAATAFSTNNGTNASNMITMMSDSTNWVPDISLMFLGKTYAGENHNGHADAGHITLNVRGDPMLIDPGYNESGPTAHSVTKIGNTDSGNVTGGGVVIAAKPAASAGINVIYQGVTTDLSATYGSTVLGTGGFFHRTVATYQGTSADGYKGRAVIILDDINVTNGVADAILTRFQTVRNYTSQTTTVPYYYSLSGGAGTNSQAQMLFYGPTVSLSSPVAPVANAFGSLTSISSASATSGSNCVTSASLNSSLVGYRLGGTNIPAATYIVAVPGTCSTGQAQISGATTGTVSGTLYAARGASWVFDSLSNGWAGTHGYNWTWTTLPVNWTLPTSSTNATPLVTVILLGTSGSLYESSAPSVTITPSTSVNIAFASGGTLSFSYSGGQWVLN